MRIFFEPNKDKAGASCFSLNFPPCLRLNSSIGYHCLLKYGFSGSWEHLTAHRIQSIPWKWNSNLYSILLLNPDWAKFKPISFCTTKNLNYFSQLFCILITCCPFVLLRKFFPWVILLLYFEIASLRLFLISVNRENNMSKKIFE